MNKRNRVMEIFYRFMSGEHMAVKDLAAEYEVSEKSIPVSYTHLTLPTTSRV